MFPKPLAIGLLGVSCVVAAGGGAYLATLQHARSSTAAAAVNSPVAAVEPQPVASAQPTPATASDPGPQAEAAAVTTPATPPGTSSPAEPPVVKKTAPKTAEGRAPKSDIPATTPSPTEVPPVNQGAAPVSPAATPQSGDGANTGQRPWPGPPSATTPVPPIGAGESGRPDLETPIHDNVKLWEELVVPTESVLGLQLETALNSEQAKVEDRVDARVTRDVRVNGRVAIPSGSQVVGAVVLVERGGRVKERARIGIRFNTLVLADGTRMALTTDTLYRESESPANKASAKIGGAAIGGAIIGAIIGGGKGAAIGSGIGAAGGTAATMASDRMTVVMPAGTTVSVRTQAPISVMVEK